MKNIILIGMPGCGKTTIGKLLAKKLNLAFLDCDNVIEEAQGIPITQIFKNYGEPYFRKLESKVLAELSETSNAVISTGGGVVESSKNTELLKKCENVVFINRPPDLILSDIDVSKRPLLKDSLDTLLSLYERRLPLYKAACHIEIDNIGTLDEAVAKIMNEVNFYG